MFGDATVTNCTLIGNSASNNGGGIFNDLWSHAMVSNCTITENSAGNNGGGIYTARDHSSVLTVINCILWGDIGGEIYNQDSDLTVTYSDVQGGYPGRGNIDADPLFVTFHGFDYLLHPSSPCVDTGDPSIEDFLYDWHPRWPDWYPNGSRSDMGAYGGPGNVEWLQQ
jgi:predicted outer membrane repeat protein